mmetsp:Transcript_4813/g.17003  ORF Transcript_4813/g.17003 Transcript_4813/m.17003 type:complete len:1121 (-) Transcript_4813:109-3471(-)|eukprot:CAMPEP_0114629998 /NCGR_PEP_ID=MMETSP0168-20121206/13655_1 /TAXON_ID=95228 ORGANISM="Vannella sp., Strain DIVA3 517/6/12" /NCGR_SAMPLE_ID=MMETSP0168 /ASSEMBLY_ACC=CAM_ASM_000044 /LENGTH=1120 /DNA_ID=CAMNT_0001841489 /DNA_START=200 /DNA_END=3562 /DNA_ORIENTATION=-
MPTGLSSENADDGVQLSASKVTVTGALDFQQSKFVCTLTQEFNSGENSIPKGAFRCDHVSKPWIFSLQMESGEKLVARTAVTRRLPIVRLPGGDDDWYLQTGPLSQETSYSVQLVYHQPFDASTGSFEILVPTGMAKSDDGASLAVNIALPDGWFAGAASHGQAVSAAALAFETAENVGENLVLSFTTQPPAAPEPAPEPEPEAATAPAAAEEATVPAPVEKAEETPAPASTPSGEAPAEEGPAAEEAVKEAPAAEEKKEETPAKAEETAAKEEEPAAKEAPAKYSVRAAVEASPEPKEEAKEAPAAAEEAKKEAAPEVAKEATEADKTPKEPERYNKDKADEYVPPNDDDDEEDEEYSDEEESEEESDDEALGKYSVEFLMKFKPMNTERPEDMPHDLDIILGNDVRGNKGNDRRRRKGRKNGGGGGGRSGRGNRKDENGNAGPSMLKQSENGWKRPDRNQEGEDAAREEALRKANGILNRLTYENYDSLTKQLEEIAFKDVPVMVGVINLIFDKALSGQKFSKIYAELCDQFNKNAPVLEADGQKVSFIKLLLNKCQEEFENKPLTAEVKLQYGDLSDYEIEVKMKARLLSNIKFIGELFLLKMLSTVIVKECVVRLFGDVTKIPPEDDLESLCKLLKTTGKTLEKLVPEFTHVVFEDRFRALLDRKDIEPRCKFMIMDLLDLRRDRWVPKRKELAPTTIKEVHAAAKKDEMQQKQRNLTRSADNVGRRGGGGDEWGNRRGGGGRDRDRYGGGKKGGKFGGRRDSDSRQDSRDRNQKGGRRPSLTASATNANSGGGSGGGGGNGGDSGWETVGGNKGQRNTGGKQRAPRGGSGGAPGWKSQSDNLVPTGAAGGGGKSRNAFGALKTAGERGAERRGSGGSGGGGRGGGGLAAKMLARGGGGFRPRGRDRSDDEEEEEEKPQNNFTPEEIKRKIDSIIEEYDDLRDPEEAKECMAELCSPESHYLLVVHGLRTITKATKIDLVHELLKAMYDVKVIKTEDIIKGIAEFLETIDDVVDDVPLAPAFVGTLTGRMINDAMLPLVLLKEPIQPLVDSGKAAQLLCKTLSAMMEKNDTARMKQHLSKAGIQFADFAPEKKREDPEALKALIKDDDLAAILIEA